MKNIDYVNVPQNKAYLVTMSDNTEFKESGTFKDKEGYCLRM